MRQLVRTNLCSFAFILNISADDIQIGALTILSPRNYAYTLLICQQLIRFDRNEMLPGLGFLSHNEETSLMNVSAKSQNVNNLIPNSCPVWWNELHISTALWLQKSPEKQDRQRVVTIVLEGGCGQTGYNNHIFCNCPNLAKSWEDIQAEIKTILNIDVLLYTNCEEN